MVNSITKSCVSKLVGMDLFKGYRERHPEAAKMVDKVPIVVCKVVELGMKGAFFVARRVFKDME